MRRPAAPAPPRLRPTAGPRSGRPLSWRPTGRGDWAGRKSWVGLSTNGDRLVGVVTTRAWPGAPPPSASSKWRVTAGAGSEHWRPIPTRLPGAGRRAAHWRGRAGIDDRAGRLGLDQAGAWGLLRTTKGTGGRGPGCASSRGPLPLPPPPPPPSCREAGCGGADWRLRCFLRPGPV